MVGHRGSRATHPENTIAAFEHAIRVGADAVELDVIVTTDGVLAVSHDPVTVSFADLPPSVPDLERALAVGAGNNIVFDIEAKDYGFLTPEPHAYARMIFDAVDRASMAHRVMLRSFNHSILRAAHNLRPEIPLVALVARRPLRWRRICERAKAECISPWYKLVSKAAVRRAHDAGLFVMPWTVNRERQWARLLAMGVDGMITDDPAALVEYLRARESHGPVA